MKERKLDKLYAEFEKDYSGKSKEEMDKIISDLEKEIAGKESSLEGKEGEEKENLSKDIESKKKRIENLKGYSKNKEQIEGIKKYKGSLEGKLKTVQKTLEDDKKELKVVENTLKEINKKLSDENYTMSLDQNQYNSLLEEKANSTSKIEKLSKEICTASDRVEDLKAKISKCNLAWKTLFVNKDWDEIQRIATTDQKRFTRKIDEKNVPISEKKKATPEKMVNAILENVQQKLGKDVEKIQAEKEESKAIVPAKKESFWKKAWNKFKQFIRGDYQENTPAKESEPSKDDSGAQKEGSTKSDRDAFLEGLRQHVDKEYSKEVKAKEEERKIEAHKAKSKTEKPQTEKDEEER